LQHPDTKNGIQKDIDQLSVKHGNEGLTPYHKFGATNTRRGFVIGAVFILPALVLGGSAIILVAAFSKRLFGISRCFVQAMRAFCSAMTCCMICRYQHYDDDLKNRFFRVAGPVVFTVWI
jgi:hypothetical protein